MERADIAFDFQEKSFNIFKMQRLPIEINYQILKNLQLSDVLNFCQINKFYANLCRDSVFWKNLINARNPGIAIPSENNLQFFYATLFTYKVFIFRWYELEKCIEVDRNQLIMFLDAFETALITHNIINDTHLLIRFDICDRETLKRTKNERLSLETLNLIREEMALPTFIDILRKIIFSNDWFQVYDAIIKTGKHAIYIFDPFTYNPIILYNPTSLDVIYFIKRFHDLTNGGVTINLDLLQPTEYDGRLCILRRKWWLYYPPDNLNIRRQILRIIDPTSGDDIYTESPNSDHRHIFTLDKESSLWDLPL